MKKIILIVILLITFNISKADYIATGAGENRGSAYVDAMSKAPSGPFWEIYRIYYKANGQNCTIVWKIKK